jgi:hypothetical protein
MNKQHIIILVIIALIALFFLLNKKKERYICLPWDKACKLRQCKADTKIWNACSAEADKLKAAGDFDELVADPNDPFAGEFQFQAPLYNDWVNKCKSRKCGEGFRFLNQRKIHKRRRPGM